MNAFINQALLTGMTSAQVLKFLSGKMKGLSQSVSAAQSQGYTPDQILKFISTKIPVKNEKQAEKFANANDRYLKSVGVKTKEERQQTTNKFIQGATGLAAGALGAYGASTLVSQAAKNSPIIQNIINRAIPTGINQPVPSPSTNQNPTSSSVNAKPSPPSINPSPVSNQNISSNSQINTNPSIAPPKVNPSSSPSTNSKTIGSIPTPTRIDISPLISKYRHVFNKIKTLRDTGNDSQAIQAYFKTFQSQDIKAIEKNVKMPFENIVDQYLSENPPTSKEIQQSKIENLNQPINAPIQQNETVGNLALMPNGDIGEIQSEKNGIAKLRTDHGENHRKINELTVSPLSKPDLATLHNELLRGIESSTGKEVSRHVNWIGYDPEANELAYKPWNGEEYVFDNIPKEDVDKLTSFLSKRKTTGENFVGAYEAGTDSPVGHEMFKLLQKLKARAKEQGKPKAHVRKFETVYSAYEPAEKEAKEKKKKIEKEMKEREKRKKTKK